MRSTGVHVTRLRHIDLMRWYTDQQHIQYRKRQFLWTSHRDIPIADRSLPKNEATVQLLRCYQNRTRTAHVISLAPLYSIVLRQVASANLRISSLGRLVNTTPQGFVIMRNEGKKSKPKML